jgi:hypothetical protein
VPLAFILLILLGVAAIVIIWGHYSPRAAGMSPTQPVCARCFYRLGGWSSPICPECGGDVRALGVRTGPQTSRAVLGMLVVVFSLAAVGPLVGSAMGWLFAQRTGHAHARYESSQIPRFFVTVETEFHWRRFPPLHDHHTTLIFTRLFESSIGGAWRKGRYSGQTPVPIRTVEFDEDRPLNSASIQNAVAETLAGIADERAIVSHSLAAERFATNVVRAQPDKGLPLGTLVSVGVPPLRGTGNAGGGGGAGMHWLGIAPILLSIVLCIWLGLRAVRRWCRPGWRLPREGEWSEVVSSSGLLGAKSMNS